MSQSAPPPDMSYMVQLAQQQAAQEEADRQAALQAQHKEELAQLRKAAVSNAQTTARQYFTDRGLSADEYGDDIDAYINNLMGGVALDDEAPGQYLQNIGDSIFNSEQDEYRSGLQRTLDQLFPQNIDMTRINNSLDDPYLTSILGEERFDADKFIENMLSRGVITDPGAAAAMSELDRQAFGANARLNEIGSGVLESGRQSLRDIIGRAHEGAATTALGINFDPNAFVSEADQSFNDFITNLGGTIRSRIPGKLFDTSRLAAIAGAGQGVQNTRFNPLLGLPGPQEQQQQDDDEEEDKAINLF